MIRAYVTTNLMVPTIAFPYILGIRVKHLEHNYESYTVGNQLRFTCLSAYRSIRSVPGCRLRAISLRKLLSIYIFPFVSKSTGVQASSGLVREKRLETSGIVWKRKALKRTVRRTTCGAAVSVCAAPRIERCVQSLHTSRKG